MAHFRDCKQWRDENLSMSTTSDTAVKLYDQALHQMWSHTPDESVGGIMGSIEKMLEADPDFVMGKVLNASMKCMEVSARLSPETRDIAQHLIALVTEKNDLNEREKLHCRAIVEWAKENRYKACEIWEEILFTYPKDTLAISFSYLCYLYQGNSVMLRDGVARVLSSWDEKKDSYYGYLLNRYAFGLEETNMFALAEEQVKKGLSLNPNDSWGIHTVAHIKESTCRYNDGIDFLRSTEPVWSVNNSLSCHNYWHLSLYYIESGRYEEALTLYDDVIAPAYKKSGNVFNINDGTQLLQRLEFEGVGVGDRWKEAYASYKSMASMHTLCYDDSHMLISFLKSKVIGDTSGKDEFFDSLKSYLANGTGDNKVVTEEIGLQVFNGISAYEDGRYDDAVSSFLPVKNEIIRYGGSHAQRDLFELFLLQSCLRSPNRKHHECGRALLHERKLLKPASPMTDRMLEKLLAAHF